MENKRWITISAILFSVVFAFVYYVLFSFTLGKADIDQRTLFMNQVGLYEKQSSVKNMQDKLEKEGLKSYTMKQEDLTAVICGVSTQEKESNEIQEQLKKLNYSYIPKSVTLKDAVIIDLIDAKSYEEALERIGK